MVFNPMIDIVLISVVLVIVSQLIQKKFINREEMKENQKKMKEKQARMKELMQKGDEKSKNELDALQKEMMDSMMEMMGKTNKVMIASAVVFLPAFALLGFFYSEAIINLPIALPWLAETSTWWNPLTWGLQFYEQTNWFGWYFVSYLSLTILVNIGKAVYEKSKGVVNG